MFGSLWPGEDFFFVCLFFCIELNKFPPFVFIHFFYLFVCNLWRLFFYPPWYTRCQGFTVTATSVTGHNNHQITITCLLITRTCSHSSALISSPSNTCFPQTLTVRSTVHDLNRHQTQLYLPVTYLPDSAAILLCFPVVVPCLILILALRCSYKERTLISQQLRHIWTVSLSGFLTCQSLHTIAIPCSINHSVVSLTCCFRLCLWQKTGPTPTLPWIPGLPHPPISWRSWSPPFGLPWCQLPSLNLPLAVPWPCLLLMRVIRQSVAASFRWRCLSKCSRRSFPPSVPR